MREHVSLHAFGQRTGGGIGIPIGPMFATAQRAINLPMHVIDRLVGGDVDANIAGEIGGISIANNFAAHVDRHHPGHDGSFILEEGPDRLIEVLQQKGIDRKRFFAAHTANLRGAVLIEDMPGNGFGRLFTAAAVNRAALEVTPFDPATWFDELWKSTDKPPPRRRSGVFNLRQSRDHGPPAPEQFGEAADAIEISVPNEHPLRSTGSGGDATEANSNVLIKLLA